MGSAHYTSVGQYYHGLSEFIVPSVLLPTGMSLFDDSNSCCIWSTYCMPGSLTVSSAWIVEASCCLVPPVIVLPQIEKSRHRKIKYLALSPKRSKGQARFEPKPWSSDSCDAF